MMKKDTLIPFNGKTITTKQLKELGFNTKSINALLLDKILTRTKKGFYEVLINVESDKELMTYYLMNNLYDEFIAYFESLEYKDYQVYYYHFIYDIMTGDYANSYKSLIKCCELNKSQENINILYAFILLLSKSITLPDQKTTSLKNKLFCDEPLRLFLEYVISGDYDNACKNLRQHKSSLSQLDVMTLRNLSIKAKELCNKNDSKEVDEYHKLLDIFFACLNNHDYTRAQYYFNQLFALNEALHLNDKELNIIDDLFNCFEYIMAHPKVTLLTYRTKFKYGGDLLTNFYDAISKNDYINAFRFIREIESQKQDVFYMIYHNLLERIYNFLNVRLIMQGQNMTLSKEILNSLISDQRYMDAIEFTNKSNMDMQDKNIITTILESLINIDEMIG